MKNKKTLFQRILPLFLAIVMCITVQDMAVFAAENGGTTNCSHEWAILDPPNDVIISATCEQSGRAIFTCRKCGEKEEQVTKAYGHNWYSEPQQGIIKKPNCGETGIRLYKCKNIKCYKTKEEILPKVGYHFWDYGKVTKKATATSKGIYTFTCDMCKTKETHNLLCAKIGNLISGVPNITVRSSASTDSAIVGTLAKNTAIQVFENELINAQWTKICYDHDYSKTAYVLSQYVIITTDESKVTVGKATYKIKSKNTVEFVKTSASGTVTIPASVKIKGKTYKVTAVAAKAMKNNKKVKKVVIGSNITKIGAEAFSGCKNLKTITIKSSNLKSVGKNAIKNINKKAGITCPKKKKASYKKLFKSSTGYKKTMKIK